MIGENEKTGQWAHRDESPGIQHDGFQGGSREGRADREYCQRWDW